MEGYELTWEKILGFLTGDHWHIVFRKSEEYIAIESMQIGFI